MYRTVAGGHVAATCNAWRGIKLLDFGKIKIIYFPVSFVRYRSKTVTQSWPYIHLGLRLYTRRIKHICIIWPVKQMYGRAYCLSASCTDAVDLLHMLTN